MIGSFGIWLHSQVPEDLRGRAAPMLYGPPPHGIPEVIRGAKESLLLL